MNEMLPIIKAPITSILSIVLLYILYLYAKKHFHRDGWLRPKAIMLSLIVGLFIMPIPFLVYVKDLFSPYIIGAYVRELMISILIVIPVVLVWNVAIQAYRHLMLLIQLKRLSLIEQLDLKGRTWTALEQDIISEEEAEKVKTLRSLRKWIVQGNEVGWYEIKEQIANKPIDIQARWFVLKELSLIRQQRIGSSIPSRNHNYETKLKTLISDQPVGAVWQKLDTNLTSEDMAYEALELNAFKKWIWGNDETGWMHIDCIRQNKEIVSPVIVEFAKFELWEIEKRKKNRDIFDPLKEKRLKSLILE